ncbi:MAG: UDP-N-acetylmuramate--L-alanine ligase [Bacteroidales bacterium]|nr:UDP-N-acetylmuramate--L-alanine ligase [Bacteroidales bacterium]
MAEININKINNYFFIGIAGDGMSAIAQYLSGTGKNVSGSDRQFSSNNKIQRQKQLETEGIKCFPQDASGLTDNIEFVIISTAIEPTVPEYKKATERNIPVVMRSDILAAISKTKKTIAVSGTSGKSTVSAMIYHIMNETGYKPSLITGAGLVSIQETGKIGNAVAGKGEYLIIEADESDGSLIKYKPEIGIVLNIDKDHKELNELEELFSIFKQNSKTLIVNNAQTRTKKFSENIKQDFGYSENTGYQINNFKQNGFQIDFTINNVPFLVHQIGKHNAENVAAAVAACTLAGISVKKCANAIKSYKGIYRRHQIIAQENGITIIDDYAHNPAKLAASINACQFPESRLFVWFQPHGFTPTKFLRSEFVKEISNALRKDDEIWMSEIYYAGGTVSKDISSEDLINDINNNEKKAFYVKNRKDFPVKIKSKLKSGDIILLTGARDISLKEFAKFTETKIFE